MTEPDRRGTASRTVLFTDLVGSSELVARLGPEAGPLLREHFALLRRAIAAAGGREVKTLGDGIMVAFDSARAAVEAAVGMQRLVERRNRRAGGALAMRVGISAGDVTVEAGDLFGVPVIEAARLCAAAAGGEILAADLVRALAGEGARDAFVPVGDLELRGLPAPRTAWRVPVPADAADDRLPAGLARLSSAAFAGRAPELAALGRAWGRALAGERRAVVLAGEPGAGKTRLAAEFARTAAADGALVLYGRCEEGAVAPFRPFAGALRDLLGVLEPARLAAHVDAHGGELARLLPELARLVPGCPEPQAADPGTERLRLLDAVVGLLDAAAAQDPVLLVLDDLHLADRASSALLLHLLRAGDAPLLVLATYRDAALDRGEALTALLADLVREPAVERHVVAGLGDEDVAALVAAARGGPAGEPERDLARELRDETAGNALLTTELLRHLADTGRLEAGGLGGGPPLPESVRDLVAARLERLGSRRRRCCVPRPWSGGPSPCARSRR